MSPPGRVSLRDVRIGLVAGVSLDLEPGARIAFVGKNGAGKTSLARVIAGAARPDAGEARTSGTVGYVAQAYAASLLPWRTVRGNVALGLGGARDAIEARVREAIDGLPLEPALLGRRPYELSGGEQQLVALARALAARPDVLLLDEPFSALHARAREAARAKVRDLVAARGTTLVLVTHDRDDLALTDRAIVVGEPALEALDACAPA